MGIRTQSSRGTLRRDIKPAWDGIYKQAREAFVWLNNYQSNDLALDIETYLKGFTELSQCSIGTDQQHIASAIYSGSDWHKRLLENPWFKVWTLRDIVARGDAVFTNHEGELVQRCG